MKLRTYIVEDHEGDYNRIKTLLSQYPLFKIIGKYNGIQPYEKSLQEINHHQPEVLVIDWELGEGRNRNGERLLQNLDTFDFFGIATSWSFDAVDAIIPYDNIKFIKKQVDPIFNLEKFEVLLSKCLKHWCGRNEFELRYQQAIDDDTKTPYCSETIRAEDLVYYLGRGKTHTYTVYKDGVFITREGHIESSGQTLRKIENTGYTRLAVISKSPLTVYGMDYFTYQEEQRTLRPKKEFTSLKMIKLT